MPWLDTHKSGFLPAFEYFWNDYGSSKDNIVFVICGSATSWMIDNLANNKGGLFNRQTCRLFLEPFTLRQTREYLYSQGISWSEYEIAEKTGIAANGYLSKILENLINSSFVRAESFYGKKKKETLYQSSDYYTNFYFRFLKEKHGKDEHYWSKALDNPSRRSWTGLTFEQVCKDHVNQIKKKLGISGVLTEEYIWFVRGDEELGTSGAQIDLLIERRDRIINICEIKFSSDEYIIDKDYDLKLRNKIEAFKRNVQTRYGLQLTMITTYGVKNNKYSSILGEQVTLLDLFE